MDNHLVEIQNHLVAVQQLHNELQVFNAVIFFIKAVMGVYCIGQFIRLIGFMFEQGFKTGTIFLASIIAVVITIIGLVNYYDRIWCWGPLLILMLMIVFEFLLFFVLRMLKFIDSPKMYRINLISRGWTLAGYILAILVLNIALFHIPDTLLSSLLKLIFSGLNYDYMLGSFQMGTQVRIAMICIMVIALRLNTCIMTIYGEDLLHRGKLSSFVWILKYVLSGAALAAFVYSFAGVTFFYYINGDVGMSITVFIIAMATVMFIYLQYLTVRSIIDILESKDIHYE